MRKETESTILAEIIAGTRRKKRLVNPLKVARNLKQLYAQTKSLEQLAKNLKSLSPEMIRQFLKLNDLALDVKKLYDKGEINSIDIGYRISKLKESDQATLAKIVVDKKLNSNDVRDIVKYKVDNQSVKINDIVNKLLESKNIKVYVAYFKLDDKSLKMLENKYDGQNLERLLKGILVRVIGDKNLHIFSFKGNILTVKVSLAGLKNMRQKAKELKVPLNRLVAKLII